MNLLYGEDIILSFYLVEFLKLGDYALAVASITFWEMDIGMALDARTLMLMVITFLVFSALLLSVLWWMHHQIKGLSYWAIGMSILAAGCALVFLRNGIPLFVSVVIGNTLIAAGVATIAAGSSLFASKKPPVRLLVFLTFTLFLLLFLTHSRDDLLRGRIIISALSIGGFSFLAGLPLMQTRQGGKLRASLAVNLVMGAFFLNALVNFTRAGAVAFSDTLSGPTLWSGDITAMYYLWSSLFAGCIASGVPILVAERLSNLLRLQVREIESARNAAETALCEQRDFLAMISHEFRTPLSVIAASSEVIADNIDKRDEESADEISRIRRSTRRLANLVEGCLSDEWLASTSQITRKTQIDPHEVLESLAGEYDVRLDWMPDQPVRINADAFLFPISLSSVIDNACKYAKSRDGVRIMGELNTLHSEMLVIYVLDDGPGIADEDADRIFDKYYRGPNALQKPGTGLGLFLSSRIITLHDGTIDIANRNQMKNSPQFADTGAIVRIALPIFHR